MANSRHLGRAALALLVATAGCRRQEAARASGGPVASELATGDAGYLAPPQATGAQMDRDGVLTISGLAPPRAVVELIAPEGDRVQASADRRGAWRLRLPGDRARLYAVSALIGRRTVHAEGALVTAPGALASAVTVRAGYAALPLVARAGTDIATIDYDPEGAIAVGGDAPAGAKLALTVDGAPAAVGQADGSGRYALMAANRRLPFGPHRLQVRAAGRTADRQVALQAPTPLTAPYQVWSTAQGWRVEWALNGGGVQTTLILAR